MALHWSLAIDHCMPYIYTHPRVKIDVTVPAGKRLHRYGIYAKAYDLYATVIKAKEDRLNRINSGVFTVWLRLRR